MRTERSKVALFLGTFNGHYLMIGRYEGKNLYLIESDDLGNWGNGQLVLEPKYPWKLVQIGNCGSPVEIKEG